MNALRLHSAEPEPVQSTPNIELGLKTWRDINSWPNRWATFKAHQLAHTCLVIVEWGHIYDDGTKERAIETIIYTMVGDDVFTTRYSH